MSESTQQPIEPTDELITLRRVNAELLTKAATRRARVKELEASVSALQGQLAVADTTIHHLQIDVPLKAMAESISIAPESFIDQFSKSYRLELVKGVLTLLNSTDGKPVVGKAGKPVPFESDALKGLLTSSDNPQSKSFSPLIIASRASGASTVGSNMSGQRNTEPKPTPPRFGLR